MSTKFTSSFVRKTRILSAFFLIFGTSLFLPAVTASATCINTVQAQTIAAAAAPTPAGETPTVTTLETCGGDDVSYQVPVTATISYDGQQFSTVYATTNSVITFGRPDNTYWTYPNTPSISVNSMDWVAYPSRGDEHFTIQSSDGGFQVDMSARPYGAPTSVSPTSIIVTAAINTDGTVAISYVINGPEYAGARTGAVLNNGTVVTLEQAGATRVEVAPTLAPTPEPTPSSTPSPEQTPTPTPSNEPSVSPEPTPTQSPVVEPTPSPTPTVEPTPAPSVEPTPAPSTSPTPDTTVVTPEPQTPQPTPTPSPTPPVIDDSAIIAEQQRLAAEEAVRQAALEAARQAALEEARRAAAIARQEEAARIAAVLEAQRLAEQARLAELERQRLAAEAAARAEAERLAKAEADRIAAEAAAKVEAERLAALEAERLRIEAEENAKAEEQAALEAQIKAALEAISSEEEPAVLLPVEPEVTPIEPSEPPVEPVEPPTVDPDPTPVEPVPPVVPEPVVTPSEPPVPVLEPVSTPESTPVQSTPEPVALTEETDLESLDPETPILLDNGVILTAEVVISLQLLENPAELLQEIFTNPGAALAALGNVGADLSPEVRAKAEKVVIAAVIAGNIATTAAVASAGAASTYRRKPQ